MPRARVCLLLFSCALCACNRQDPVREAHAVVPAGPVSALDGAALVIDVRTPAEYAEGHVEGALLLPVSEIEARMGEVEQRAPDRHAKLVVYCKSGRRSAQAKGVLEAHGYKNVVNGGGYADLKGP